MRLHGRPAWTASGFPAIEIRSYHIFTNRSSANFHGMLVMFDGRPVMVENRLRATHFLLTPPGSIVPLRERWDSARGHQAPTHPGCSHTPFARRLLVEKDKRSCHYVKSR